MQFSEFLSFAPQKTFLLQGNNETFETLLGEAVHIYPLTNALSVPRFTIDHAKSVAQFLIEGTGGVRVYIAYFDVFSPEAAQVLLKSLEEPDEETIVILVTPHPYLVPQTIRSRTMLVSGNLETTKLSGTKSELLTLIKEEFGSDAEDDAATKRARAAEMLDALEVRVQNEKEKASIVYEAKKMLFTANLPTKYVLEYAVSMAL